MCGEKRTNDRPEEGGTLNSGSPACAPLETIWLQRINDFQHNEGVAKEAWDSDPPIVVGDGSADHMAKGRAERQRGQSTHARERNTPAQSVSRTLSALRAKAEKEPDQSGKFTFLGFDFHWGRSYRNPHIVNVRRRTNRKKFQASLLALKEWLKKARSLKLPDLLAVLRRKLQGDWNYYGVRGNSMMLGKYQHEVHRLLYKWLNRRSQRRSMTWRKYCERWKTWAMPAPRVMES